MSVIKTEDIHEDEQIMCIIQDNIEELFSDISFEYYTDDITCSFHLPVLTLTVEDTEDSEDKWIPVGKSSTKEINVVIEVCLEAENLKIEVCNRLYLFLVDGGYINFDKIISLKDSSLSNLIDLAASDYTVGKLIKKEITKEVISFDEPNINEPNEHKLLSDISNKLIKKTQHKLSKIFNLSFDEFQDIEAEKLSDPVDAYFDILHCYRLNFEPSKE